MFFYPSFRLDNNPKLNSPNAMVLLDNDQKLLVMRGKALEIVAPNAEKVGGTVLLANHVVQCFNSQMTCDHRLVTAIALLDEAKHPNIQLWCKKLLIH